MKEFTDQVRKAADIVRRDPGAQSLSLEELQVLAPGMTLEELMTQIQVQANAIMKKLYVAGAYAQAYSRGEIPSRSDS
jgi:hypothetical protein